MLDFIHNKVESSPEHSDYDLSDTKKFRNSMIGSLYSSSCYSRGGLDSLANSRRSKYLHIKYRMYEGGEEKSRSIGSRGGSKKSRDTTLEK